MADDKISLEKKEILAEKVRTFPCKYDKTDFMFLFFGFLGFDVFFQKRSSQFLCHSSDDASENMLKKPGRS